MNDTYFNVPPNKFPRLASVYTEDSNHRMIPWKKNFQSIDPNYPKYSTGYFSGGSRMTSTAADYGIFLQMLLAEGTYRNKRILTAKSVQLMTQDQLEGVGGFTDGDYFGLGFGITGKKNTFQNSKNEGSYYWFGYFGSYYWVDPKEKLIGIIMAQHYPNNHSELTPKVSDIIYSSLSDN